MDKGREHDLEYLNRQYRYAHDKESREAIEKAAYKIKTEDSWTKKAREALIRESQKGNGGNVKDIQEEMLRRRYK